MDLKTFFEHFDTLAEAPNGIKRLRELILDMAVRGKLVPQDPEDLTGQATFERLLKEKSNLVKDKKIRAGKKQPSVKDDEITIEIPENWKWVRLDDVGDWGAGATPLRSNGDYYGGDNFWFKSGELPDGFLDGPSNETVTDIALKECSLRLNQPGDVLIAMYGATIGKLAILKAPATTNQAVCACTCLQSVYNRYLFTFLLAWRKNFAVMGAGAAQPNISRIKIIQTPFPLPPLTEQKRIVAKVDELMGLCDALEAAQQTRNALCQNLRASALDALMNAPSDNELETAWAFVRDNWRAICDRLEDVEGLRQAVIQLAVRGKAVPALTSKVLVGDESVESQHPKKKNSLKVFPVDDYPFDLPKFWKWYRLGNLLDSLKYGTSKKCSHSLNGTPIIRIPNIDVKAGRIKNSDLKFTQLSDKELSNLCLREDDLLMIRSNGSASLVGRSAVVESDMINYGYAGYLVRLRTLEGLVFSRYLRLTLESMNVRRQIEFPIRTTSGVKNLNSTEISNLLIPLPPLAEQKRIVAKVNELMKLCDQLEASLRQQQQKAQALAASAINHLAA